MSEELLVAIVSVLATARTNRRVARLTEELEEQKLRLASELEEQRAVRDARRDYEYEARKRLYAECEPLLFEAAELAERHVPAS
jgi:biopolymer transport protein ExbB/TolQ